MRLAVGRRSGVLPLMLTCAAAVALAGCSTSSGRFGGPSWNLTGGKDAARIPDRPVYQTPQPTAAPAPDRQVPVYRGGRDPVSGRAPTWGGPQSGFATPAAQPIPPQGQVAGQTPAYQAPTYQPPQYQPPAQAIQQPVPTAAPVYQVPLSQAPAAPMPSAAPPAPQPRASAVSAPGSRIEVKPGQSLAMIATEQRVSIAALMQTNKLRDPYVIPGQVLTIPAR